MQTTKHEQEETYAVRLAKANRAASNCHLIVIVVLTLAYILEVVKGSKNISYLLVMMVLGFAPVIAELLLYRMNPVHKMIKHLVSYGYAVFYIMIMFTTDNALTFVYVLPMLIAITVYNDGPYSLKVGIGATIVNIIQPILYYSKDGFTAEEIASTEIQVAVLVIVSAFSYYTAQVSYQMNQVEIVKAENEKDRSEELLGNVLNVSSSMTETIQTVTSAMGELGESITGTKGAMDELTAGANDTAEAVQRQLEQTETIAQKVDLVKEASGQIAHNMEGTQTAIRTGNKHIEHLVKQVAQTEQTNKQVASELKLLTDYMEQMFSIIELINNITSQTSLLSLNASIEAARAGEAGRGFAVVASEISGLASQTQDATVKIENLIRNVSSEIGKVVPIIEDMISQVKSQNEAVGETAQSFAQISENAGIIEHNSDNLVSVVEELEEANRVISESIQTISSISQEVAAHTNTTYSSCIENERTIEQLIGQAEALQAMAEKLNA